MPESPAHTSLHIGRMDGRLIALESRMDRHEIFVATKLTAIEGKLDDALMTQAAGVGISGAMRWLLGIAISVAAWFHGHFTQPPTGTH